MELDTATGLYYDRARYYDAALGRFDEQDPSGFAGGTRDLYEYSSADPANLRDPSGLGPDWQTRYWHEQNDAQPILGWYWGFRTWRGDWQKWVSDNADQMAHRISQRLAGSGCDDGVLNAARHAAMQMMLTLLYDEGTAKALADNHENHDGSSDYLDAGADQYNNQVGRNLAQEMFDYPYYNELTWDATLAIMEQKILLAIQRGEFIVCKDGSDERNWDAASDERLRYYNWLENNPNNPYRQGGRVLPYLDPIP